MTARNRIVTIVIDGMWMPMDFARLMHLMVRFHRFEQIVLLAETGGRNLFEDRLNAVALKYLAAFDWIAAPLMSGRFNDSLANSEAFVRDLGLNDLRIDRLEYASPGQASFLGVGAIIDRMHTTLADVIDLHRENSGVAGDAQGKISAMEVMYVRNFKAKAELIADAGYSDAELNAIVSPSLEDLHFIGNAVTQGRIVTVEKQPAAR